MTRDEKVAMAWAFWDLQNERRVDDAFDLLHPDGGYASICMQNWEPMMNESGWLRKFIGIVVEETTLRYHRGDAIVEGDTVVLQFSGTFRLPGEDNDRDQSYCMIMTFRDDKIFMIREFLDTKKEDPLIAFVLKELEAREGKAAIEVDVAKIALP